MEAIIKQYTTVGDQEHQNKENHSLSPASHVSARNCQHSAQRLMPTPRRLYFPRSRAEQRKLGARTN
ncbi:uncharacterized protein MYCGRDRAFT_83159, partial [Zymoseptoria tritici IPO323]